MIHEASNVKYPLTINIKWETDKAMDSDMTYAKRKWGSWFAKANQVGKSGMKFKIENLSQHRKISNIIRVMSWNKLKENIIEASLASKYSKSKYYGEISEPAKQLTNALEDFLVVKRDL